MLSKQEAVICLVNDMNRSFANILAYSKHCLLVLRCCGFLTVAYYRTR